MERGIKQLLGIDPYKSVDSSPVCEHRDDGFIYGETMTRRTLRCEECGMYYEEKK
jgi:hypothetical protein